MAFRRTYYSREQLEDRAIEMAIAWWPIGDISALKQLHIADEYEYKRFIARVLDWERKQAMLRALEQRYSADQPRVPAGSPDGGQWIDYIFRRDRSKDLFDLWLEPEPHTDSADAFEVEAPPCLNSIDTLEDYARRANFPDNTRRSPLKITGWYPVGIAWGDWVRDSIGVIESGAALAEPPEVRRFELAPCLNPEPFPVEMMSSRALVYLPARTDLRNPAISV